MFLAELLNKIKSSLDGKTSRVSVKLNKREQEFLNSNISSFTNINGYRLVLSIADPSKQDTYIVGYQK